IYVPYSSLERVVEENREQYYRALRSAQGTLDKDESHLMDWLRFFLLCLVEQKNSLAEKVKRERLMTALSTLDEQLLQLARQHGRLTLTSALAITKANRNTLKLHLRQLVQSGRLQLHGHGRSSWYEAVSWNAPGSKLCGQVQHVLGDDIELPGSGFVGLTCGSILVRTADEPGAPAEPA